METPAYRPRKPIRIVTAASLFDGHDAAINIMRRILQASGAEVVHLGHNRSVKEVVETAIQEDAQGIAVSSYQGGHVEYFKYMHDLLRDRDCGHIKIFGGGGGVIVPEEIAELESYGIARIFSPDDGMRLGLQGMINEILEACETVSGAEGEAVAALPESDFRRLAVRLTGLEEVRSAQPAPANTPAAVGGRSKEAAPVIGVTGTGGAGKSTLTDELIRRFLFDFDDIRIAVLSVDPTRSRTGGALLGDRIRMNAIYGPDAERVYMRSFATRQAHLATSRALLEAIELCRESEFDIIFVETAGIGQSDTEISDLANLSVYVMTQEFGAPTQLEKIGMLDVADFVVLNKFEKRGSEDALRDVRRQLQRNRGAWDSDPDEMPVHPTMASHFNDPGVTRLYVHILESLDRDFDFGRTSSVDPALLPDSEPTGAAIIPPRRQRYLSDVAETVQSYRRHVEDQIDGARQWGQVVGTLLQLQNRDDGGEQETTERLTHLADQVWLELDAASRQILDGWDERFASYSGESTAYTVRDREIRADLYRQSLAGTKVPRVALPRAVDPGERLRFALLENLPGYFPYTAGVFPFKREGEDPARMFAGEGGPERTNRRFHLVSHGLPARRLSTAFDSVTLYGFDPDERPDIYGKVGNAGVSICTLDDMKKLYSGFDLCDPSTSVSMTINGPAPMILAMFMNTAVDQQVEKYLRAEGRWEAAERLIEANLGEDRPTYVPLGSEGRVDGLPEGHDGSGLGLLGTTASDLVEWDAISQAEYMDIRSRTLGVVRGTVQADILKEDQAQNTCIFSTEFALRMMGDVQQYFIDNIVRNYYSVSISGYHIAEAGANPITQLALTLANGFTYVEYYLSRGMNIDDFAPSLSFFFSNGLDPEYSVIGRVARRIWAVAMRDLYGASERSQKLKYHIQTSGRSLHAKEIQFNDIRTTLQALMAVYDNCNSLHTNAYDEAITTPTEESVRRAMAIQMIIGSELGLAQNENPLQGAYIIDELTDLVEDAVLAEFERLDARGGVLGAMETMYQRGKIQDESMLYERKKHSGELPVVGVNTFLPRNGQDETPGRPVALMRSSDDEKDLQMKGLRAFHRRNSKLSPGALTRLQSVAQDGGNLFGQLMETVKTCSLGQITQALFAVGGQYRRGM